MFETTDPEFGFWLKAFEAEHGRPPNEAEKEARRREMAEMGVQYEKDQARRKQLAQQADEDVEIPVGTCHCGGIIRCHSRFVSAIPFNAMRLGGQNPMKEERSIYCSECGVWYSPEHPPFCEKLASYRERE